MINNYNHSHFFPLLLLGWILVFAACKSPVVPSSRTPIKDIEIKELTKSIAKNQLDYKKFRSRVKTTYDNGKRKQQIIINLRLEKSKSIWMSATMIVPIAKLLVTPERVSFYEKFEKTFFEGDVSFINQQFETSFEFKDLQNLLMGLPLININRVVWKAFRIPNIIF